jgi:hypothetical protein
MSEQRVFISHSTDDRPLVESALKWLQESEFRSAQIDDPSNWSPVAGDDVRSAITDKIRQADTVMLLWSDRAAKSAWVQYEVGMAQALGVPIRVMLAAGSRAKLPTGLARKAVIKLDAAKAQSDVAAPAPHTIEDASLSTALRGLSVQYQRIEEQIQEVRAILGGTSGAAPDRATGVNGTDKKRLLSAVARECIAAAAKRRWADKRNATSDSSV